MITKVRVDDACLYQHGWDSFDILSPQAGNSCFKVQAVDAVSLLREYAVDCTWIGRVNAETGRLGFVLGVASFSVVVISILHPQALLAVSLSW